MAFIASGRLSVMRSTRPLASVRTAVFSASDMGVDVRRRATAPDRPGGRVTSGPMDTSDFTITGSDGETIVGYRWSGPGPTRAIVQIAHGMGEHAARYARLAAALVDRGYVVYANDHRGHGRTAGSRGPPRRARCRPDGPGWSTTSGRVSALARSEHPGVPLVVLGHSMGSFALQQHLLDHSADLDAAVLSGTSAGDVIAAGIDTEPAGRPGGVQRRRSSPAHRVRVAEPGRGRGRRVRRRSRLRVLARHAGDGRDGRGDGGDGRPRPPGRRSATTCRSTCSPATPTRWPAAGR